LPLEYDVWRSGTKRLIAWSHILIVERPLTFPVFGTGGTNATVGTKWESPLAPFITLRSTVDRLLMNKLSIQDLFPSKMHSEFTRWRTFRRRKCAEIKFSMNVKSSEKIEQGKEKGTFSLNGTSIFDPELGWPLMTEYKAEGITIDEEGKQHDFFLERREVMVSVKKLDEAKPPQKPPKRSRVKKTTDVPATAKKQAVPGTPGGAAPGRDVDDIGDNAGGGSDGSAAASSPTNDSRTSWTVIISAILLILLLCGGFLLYRSRLATKKQ